MDVLGWYTKWDLKGPITDPQLVETASTFRRVEMSFLLVFLKKWKNVMFKIFCLIAAIDYFFWLFQVIHARDQISFSVGMAAASHDTRSAMQTTTVATAVTKWTVVSSHFLPLSCVLDCLNIYYFHSVIHIEQLYSACILSFYSQTRSISVSFLEEELYKLAFILHYVKYCISFWVIMFELCESCS